VSLSGAEVNPAAPRFGTVPHETAGFADFYVGFPGTKLPAEDHKVF